MRQEKTGFTLRVHSWLHKHQKTSNSTNIENIYGLFVALHIVQQTQIYW